MHGTYIKIRKISLYNLGTDYSNLRNVTPCRLADITEIYEEHSDWMPPRKSLIDWLTLKMKTVRS